MKNVALAVFVFAALSLLAAPLLAAGDAAKGKGVYMANCIACHNPDPTKDGALGPAIKGSSKALIEARVLNGSIKYDQSYPKGYKPKRDTRFMVPLPHLKPSLDDIAAFLNS